MLTVHQEHALRRSGRRNATARRQWHRAPAVGQRKTITVNCIGGQLEWHCGPADATRGYNRPIRRRGLYDANGMDIQGCQDEVDSGFQ
jgi:hypothetical protein